VRRVPFSCFARSDSFSAVSRASDHVFMFFALGHVFCGAEGVRSRFHVLNSRTRFRRYRGRRVPSSCFACPDSFSAETRASTPVFMFCVPGIVFDGTEGSGSRFHVLRTRTHFRRFRGHWVTFSCLLSRERFRRYRWRQVSISCFALPDLFSTVPWASVPVFMFYVLGLIFGGTEGVMFRFHILRSRTRFRRYRGRLVQSSCFAFPDSFSAVPSASGPVFMFCAPGHFFGGFEGVGYRFHILHVRTRYRRYRGRHILFSCFSLPDMFSAVPRASSLVFLFCPPGHVFGGLDGVVSRFHVFRSRTFVRQYRGHRVPFSCFAFPDSFSEVPSASGLVFMYCAPRVVFCDTVGVQSRFHVFRSWTCFRRSRGRRVPFSCFALRDMFSAVQRASCPVFIFCASGHVFGNSEGLGYRFDVLHTRTCFRRNRGRRLPFSCFAFPDSFHVVLRVSGHVFMF
jgi:hypothetical protein